MSNTIGKSKVFLEMNFKSGALVIFSCLLSLCSTQTYYNYPARRVSGYSYRQPTNYDQSKTNYRSTVNINVPATAASYYSTRLNAASASTNTYKQSSNRNSYPYSSSPGSYKSANKALTLNRNYVAQSPAKVNYRSSTPISSSNAATNSYYSALDTANAKPYLSNSYNSYNNKRDNAKNTNLEKYHVSKADSENAKFAGAENQENDEDGRTAFLVRRKFRRWFVGALGNPCSGFGRHARIGVTPRPGEQGRFLWDINVYNVYPQTGVAAACGGLGGGLLSDPIAPVPYYPPGAGLANFLGFFAPGILQNSLPVNAPPQQFADQAQDNNNDLQNDPEVDPYYRPPLLPVRRPNQVFYDSAGAPPVTPAQLVGGISTTVNGIIQQLTGNVQPVYGG